MGSCLCKKNVSNIEVADYIPYGSSFHYLRPCGTITVNLDRKWNVPVIDIDFERWYEKAVHVWPKDNVVRENVLLLERTPLPSPSVSRI